MAIVEMYTTSICAWCIRAKRLLAVYGIGPEHIREINVDFDRTAMVERTGGTTVPQILIGGTLVGGYDDLTELDGKGGLKPLIDQARATER